MNYFRVQAVSLSGFRGISIEIECAQSRRLPFIQILGASPAPAGELRERVSSAIEASGLRLPGRKVTVRFLPGIQGFPLENLDLAVALAILAASGRVPVSRLENVLVSGSLALNGRINGIGAELAVRKAMEEKKYAGAIVPWSESASLAELNPKIGGGFQSLSEVVAYLSGQSPGKYLSAQVFADESAPWAFGERESRAMALSAAGNHHSLFILPGHMEVAPLARATARLLPPLRQAECWEAEAIARLRPERGLRPCIPFTLQNGKIPEVQLAKFGILFLERAAEQENALLSPLIRWMKSGWIEEFRLPREIFAPLVVAGSSVCECGGEPRCSCRPLERQRYRQKFEMLSSGGFGMRLAMGESSQSIDIASMRADISAARARMQERQGMPNGKVSHEEVLKCKEWQGSSLRAFRSICSEAGFDLRAQANLARLALTVSDLRDSNEVAETDVLEARHYFCSV